MAEWHQPALKWMQMTAPVSPLCPAGSLGIHEALDLYHHHVRGKLLSNFGGVYMEVPSQELNSRSWGGKLLWGKARGMRPGEGEETRG